MGNLIRCLQYLPTYLPDGVRSRSIQRPWRRAFPRLAGGGGSGDGTSDGPPAAHEIRRPRLFLSFSLSVSLFCQLRPPRPAVVVNFAGLAARGRIELSDLLSSLVRYRLGHQDGVHSARPRADAASDARRRRRMAPFGPGGWEGGPGAFPKRARDGSVAPQPCRADGGGA